MTVETGTFWYFWYFLECGNLCLFDKKSTYARSTYIYVFFYPKNSRISSLKTSRPCEWLAVDSLATAP